MAPNTVTSSQQLLVQAAEKLSTAVTAAGTAPNDFAKSLLELLEVSTKINEFDQMVAAANEETTSAEAQQWREISLMTMQHARTHLVEQQQRLVEELRTLSDSGASLYTTAGTNAIQTAVKPPPGLEPQDKPDQMAVKPPPGLAAPPGLPVPGEMPNCKAPSGLKPPPGLASAGTAHVVPPPGFNAPANRKPTAHTTKKQAPVHPWRINKDGSPKSKPSQENTQSVNMGVINLDAYESD
eukprot:gnl/MRDRNA2_/MRDRNA2_87007_c0_seq1.p1 gnl/MRDRNA2_/MRDRNA2_87007_c0~~gnl/MRDRNA2_/MRDRNA2_87007_c0_seq1.p1  ORF type:complete len:280 (-),score=63.08 gnl/MRDRNA2_/MRDRNA2_87007_c0_seq1:193-909(-)